MKFFTLQSVPGDSLWLSMRLPQVSSGNFVISLLHVTRIVQSTAVFTDNHIHTNQIYES